MDPQYTEICENAHEISQNGGDSFVYLKSMSTSIDHLEVLVTQYLKYIDNYIAQIRAETDAVYKDTCKKFFDFLCSLNSETQRIDKFIEAANNLKIPTAERYAIFQMIKPLFPSTIAQTCKRI